MHNSSNFTLRRAETNKLGALTPKGGQLREI